MVRQILPWFAIASLGLTLVFLTTQAVRVGPVFIGSGAGFTDVVLVVALLLVPVLGWAMTPAFSIAVFATVGRMTADRELVVLSASGLSRKRIAMGPLLLTAILFCCSLWIWLDLAPRSQGVLRSTWCI